MSDFKAKMHQIRFRLRLRPRPRWGSLQRSPRPPSWILRGKAKQSLSACSLPFPPLDPSKGREGREGKGKETKGKGGERGDGKGKGEGREKEGEGKGPPEKNLATGL